MDVAPAVIRWIWGMPQDVLLVEKEPLLSGKCHSIEKETMVAILTDTYKISQLPCTTETVTSCDQEERCWRKKYFVI